MHVGGANGDLEAKQLGAFGLSFFGICGLYVCILLYDVNTCMYIYICGIHAYFFGGHDIWGILDIRIFHRIHWIHHPNDIYITVIVKQMMVEFMKSI